MKLIVQLIFILASLSAWADNMKIEVNPLKPVVGEVFQVYFRIFTESDAEPVVNFVPSGVEVVGKSNQGVSTRTVYANGKLTVTRELTVVYELVASKVGSNYIRDITVQVGDKVLRHPSVSFNILKESETLSDVFVMADVSKKEVYLGEGVVVRYYLYSKFPVNNLDIKKYPKLNNFLKRFLQEAERTERVSVEGQIYMRTQIYAAKLFPEKIGELNIDPLYLTATYPNSRPGDPFGAFGLSRDFRTRSMNSEAMKILVKPLPTPIPEHFIGLVGQHEFELRFSQNKLIVNEPLEVKLTVTGNGALENLEAPEIVKNPGLEEFETNGDLKISDAELATKIFDYTFLAKSNLKMPARTIVLSYFDPTLNKYVPTKLNIPELEIAGEKAERPSQSASKNEQRKNEVGVKASSGKDKELAPPLAISVPQWKKWLPLLNLCLGGLAILISFSLMFKKKRITYFNSKYAIPSNFKKGDFQLKELAQWMTPVIEKTGKSPIEIIRLSTLPEDSKRYFIDLLTANDYKDYSLNKKTMQFKYQAGHFKELGRYITSVRNEDSSQPS